MQRRRLWRQRQRRAHSHQERIQRYGLFNDTRSAKPHRFDGVGNGHEAADKDERHTSKMATEHPRYIDAQHVRESLVKENDVDPSCPQSTKCIAAVCSGRNGEALKPKGCSDRFPRP